jgi:hypothetical protein
VVRPLRAAAKNMPRHLTRGIHLALDVPLVQNDPVSREGIIFFPCFEPPSINDVAFHVKFPFNQFLNCVSNFPFAPL